MKNSKYNPLVSIIIPVYNREIMVLDALKSAVGQTYKNIEVIVVDNKSTDGTYKVLKDFENVTVYQNEKNLGPVLNWQKCVEYANGEFVKIIWSDDYIGKTFVEKTLPYFNNKDVGFVFTGTEVFFDDSRENGKMHFYGNTGLYDSKDFIRDSLLYRRVPGSPGCALFRKKDFKRNLLIDIPNKVGSDFKMHAIGNDALIFRLTAKDYPKFAFINESLSFFRSHGGSITISTNGYKMIMTHFLARSYFCENYLNNDSLRRKFNARIITHLLFGDGRKSGIGVRSVQDYYFDKGKADVNHAFMVNVIIRKLFTAFVVRLYKLFEFCGELCSLKN